MPDIYPLPAHAASFWIAGDDLMIAFPGVGTAKGHTVRMPASAAGLAAAISILKDRAAASDLRIGHKGTPTQYDLEKIAGFMEKNEELVERRKERARERNQALQDLDELGL